MNPFYKLLGTYFFINNQLKNKSKMGIIVNGLFNLNEDKNFVIIDKNKNEKGTLEIENREISVKIGSDVTDFDTEEEVEKWLTDNGYVLTEESLRWIDYNPNPAGNSKANDCSIRAYCAAENIKWDEAYDIAYKYGKDLGYMMNDNITCKHILENEFGYDYHKLKKDEKENNGIVKDFAINHSEGIYVLDCPSHLVTVINGEYYDSWDSGKKKIKGYYYKQS